MGPKAAAQHEPVEQKAQPGTGERRRAQTAHERDRREQQDKSASGTASPKSATARCAKRSVIAGSRQ